MKSLLERVRSKADKINALPVASYDPNRPGSLYAISQVVLDRSSTLSIAWALTGEQSYSDRLWRELQAVAQFANWNPAHFLDTATLIQATAIGLDTLRERWSASQTATLERAIIDKGLAPARDAYSTKASWTTSTSNWNVVSNAGVGIGALALRDSSTALSTQMLDLARNSLTNGLRGFQSGGGYQEGPQYWEYALQHLVTFATALKSITGSDRDIFSSPGLRETVSMSWQLASPLGTPFNYSDSNIRGYTTPALLVLGQQYGSAPALAVAREAFATADINQWALIWYDPKAVASAPGAAGAPLTYSFGGSNVAAMRSNWTDPSATYVAMKAASNDGNGHPELDAGTFVMSALGVDWGIDLGPDNYSLAGYDNGRSDGERWNYYRKRSEGNNTLAVGLGSLRDQKPTVSSSITTASAVDSAFAIADLTAASEPLTSWRRGAALLGERSTVRIQDEIASAQPTPIVWSMHTRAGIAISADGRTATLTQDGEQLRAQIAAPSSARFTWSSAQPSWSSPNPSGQDRNTDVRKLSVQLTNVTSATLVVDMIPVRAGQALPQSPVLPLSQWATPQGTPELLSGLSLDGLPLRGFTPDTVAYTVPVAAGGQVPAVGTRSASAGSNVSITQPSGVPGEATITTSAPGKRSVTYRIHLARGPLEVVNATSSTSWAAAQATIDKDMATKWVGGGNQWLQYDFRVPIAPAAVRVRWAATGPTDTKFGIVTKDSAGRWVTRYSGGLPTDTGWRTYPLASSSSRYVGVVIDNQMISSRYTGVHEIEFLAHQPTVAPLNTVHPLTLSNAPTTLRVGDGVALNVSAPGAGEPTRTSTVYGSSNPSVLEINSTGRLTAKSEGKSRIGVSVTRSDGSHAWVSTEVSVTNPWTSALRASADTYTYNSSTARTTNFGNAQALFVKRHDVHPVVNREAYVRFPLSSFSGKTITGAVLEFYGNTTDSDGTVTTIDARAITSAWDESTVTYATKPTLGSVLGSTTVTNTAATYSIDVTEYVRQQVAAGKSAEIGLDQTAPPGGGGLLVIVYGKDSSRPPVLRVTSAYEP